MIGNPVSHELIGPGHLLICEAPVFETRQSPGQLIPFEHEDLRVVTPGHINYRHQVVDMRQLRAPTHN